jgi:drug/metabolite transporter (DMT)-like permease
MAEAYGALSISEAAIWLQLTPLAQYALAALLLGEAITAAGTIGVLVGVAGVAYGTVLGQRRAPAVPPAEAAGAGPG